MIPAYSPKARGRSERAFAAHQARLPKELALAVLTDMAAANRYLEEAYQPAFNREFAHKPQEDGSAFVPFLVVAWTRCCAGSTNVSPRSMARAAWPITTPKAVGRAQLRGRRVTPLRYGRAEIP